MKKKLLVLAIIFIFVIVILVQCNQNPLDSNNNNSDTVVGYGDRIGFDLPSSLSSSSTKVVRTNSQAVAEEIFDLSRSSIGIAEIGTAFIRNTVTDIKTFLTNWIDWTGTNTTTGLIYQIKNLTNQTYEHEIGVYDLSMNSILEIKLTEGVSNTLKGVATLSLDKLENSLSSNQRMIHLEFDSTGISNYMHIELSGYNTTSGISNQNWELKNMVIDAVKKDNIITVSANAFFPIAFYYDPFFGSTTNVDKTNSYEERSYSFVAKCDVDANKSAISVAIPQPLSAEGDAQSLTTRAFYSNYSAALLYKNAVVSYVQNTPGHEYSDYCNSLGITSVSSNKALTEQNILDLINSTNQSVRTNQGIKQMKVIFELDNPVYFDANGYINNGTNIPSGWENLTLDDIDVLSLTNVRNLNITF